MKKSTFNYLLIISLVLPFIGIIIGILTYDQLPMCVQIQIAEADAQFENSNLLLPYLIATLCAFGYLIYVYILLFKLKKSARFHAVLFSCLGLVSVFSGGFHFGTTIEALFYDLGTIAWGMILAVLFFSDLKVNFESK